MEEKTTLADLAGLLIDLPPGRRRIVALVGAPGSGKSHVADDLAARINAAQPGRAAVLPMDGYHYDDMLLADLDRLPRKGAPDTFDVGGLAAMLDRLSANDEEAVAVPVFDRTIEIARAGARLIPKTTEVIVVEGNYLLLDEAPWDALALRFDLTVRLDVPEAVLRARLTGRWEGLGLSRDAVRVKLEEVDLPNGRRVSENSRPAHFRLSNEG